MIDRMSYTWVGTRRLSRLALVFCSAFTISACAQNEKSNIFNFGLLGENKPSTAAANMDPTQDVAHYSSAYAADPKDKQNALNYAAALRKTGNQKRALAVLRAASVHHEEEPEFLSAYGRAALANGQAAAAAKILARADDPSQPDWRTVSARGTAYAQLGKYKQANEQFERALKLAPGNPSVMNNLAMAKAATGDLKGAEALLRQAGRMPVVDPKVKQNLAIVLRLQGRNDEAEKLVNAPPAPVSMRQTVSPAQLNEPRRRQFAKTE